MQKPTAPWIRQGMCLAVMVTLLPQTTLASGWRNQQRTRADGKATAPLDSSSPLLHAGHACHNAYSVVLNELQALESEPSCHGIAARLLVNNCELLNGETDATLMTNTGRAARDFVDFFAASLAICDLERAKFEIPRTCNKFREPVLGKLSTLPSRELHVTTLEIEDCIKGLGRSDSAWTTWLSYRHQALGFCEAARVDYDKDNQIRLLRQVVNLMQRAVNEADTELEDRQDKFDQVLQKSVDNRMAALNASLMHLEQVMAQSALPTIKETTTFIDESLNGARSLHRLMEIMFQSMTEREEELTKAHETALEVAVTRINQGAGDVSGIMEALTMSSLSLQEKLERSEIQITSVLQRQNQVQQELERYYLLVGGIDQKLRSVDEMLTLLNNETYYILSSLEAIAFSMGNLHASFSELGWSAWWPYIICPAASLYIGSYGLQPSITRNILLLGVGEVAGFFMSLANIHGSKI